MFQEQIRNFVIIAHIDHGKSTLADRFLQITKTIAPEKMHNQYLDMMDLEQEKGITIKMQPVRMIYNLSPDSKYIFNLIDTPGHVDFSYEVSRSLAAVEGAILLVDIGKGIQAQTLAHLELARKQNLIIIPAMNKIDLPFAKTKENEIIKSLTNLLSTDENEILKISAKQNINIEEILLRIIKKVPSPKGNPELPLRALIFDSKYDPFKGIIAYVRIIDGHIQNKQKIYFLAKQIEAEVKEIGYFVPEMTPREKLFSGEIGYIATGIKEPAKVKIGDTITLFEQRFNVFPVPGYQEPQPVIFASFYLQEKDDFDLLKDALYKLKLEDPSLSFEPESKNSVLGRGFKCGFLGMLHLEIITERLSREFNLQLIISHPSVIFKIIDKKDQIFYISSPSLWPSPIIIKEIQEPHIELEIFTPLIYLGKIFEILKQFKAEQKEIKYLNNENVIIVYNGPLRILLSGFYDRLKGISQGYGSMNYKVLDYKKADLAKLEILIAGQKEEVFSKIVSRDRAYEEGREILEKLKKYLPPQLFAVSLQAMIEGKIICREDLRAKRKDVIAPLYGGDYTRKRKLLEKQKKGKKKLKEIGKIKIPQKTFLEILKIREG